MDVKLPNGQVLQGVPEGTTQQELLRTLHANGIHWLPEDAPPNPVEGEGALQRGWEAFGSTLPRMFRGAEQLLGTVSQADEAEARKLDAPLMDTTAGKVGRIAGDALVTAPAFMVGGGIPAAIGAGAVLGALQPTVEGESRGKNAALGGAGGAAGVLAGRAIPAAYRSVRAATDPLFAASGQRNIAARALARATDDPRALAASLDNPAQLVASVQPTTAEVGQQVGLSRLEKSLRQRDTGFAEDLAGRQEANNAARLDALGDVVGTDAQMAQAVAARDQTAQQLYAAARGAPVRGDAELVALVQRPAIRKAIQQAQTDARNAGGQTTAGDYLHRVKMALDGMIETGPQRGIAASTNRAVTDARNAFLQWVEQRVPQYRTARETYAQMSQPINQMEAGREIVRRSTGNVQDRLGNAAVQENKLAGLLKNNPELLDALTPQQRQTIQSVMQDVSRSSGAQRLAAAGGSDTAQNMIGQNLLSEGLGGISPLLARFANTAPGRAVGALLQTPYRLAGSEQAIQQELAQLLMNPQQAAQALRNVTPSERSRILAELLNNMNAATGAAVATAP